MHIDSNMKNKNITESLTSGIKIHQYVGNGEVTEEAPRIPRGLVVVKAKKTNRLLPLHITVSCRATAVDEKPTTRVAADERKNHPTPSFLMLPPQSLSTVVMKNPCTLLCHRSHCRRQKTTTRVAAYWRKNHLFLSRWRTCCRRQDEGEGSVERKKTKSCESRGRRRSLREKNFPQIKSLI